MAKLPKYPYNSLNQISKAKFQRLYSPKNNNLADIRDATYEALYDKKVDIAGEYTGVVLKRFQGGELSTFERFSELIGFGDPEIYKYKVRVPEVHAHLPEPNGQDSAADCLAIESHDTFSIPKESDNEIYECGDLVRVTFVDGGGAWNPRIIKSLTKGQNDSTTCLFNIPNNYEQPREVVAVSEPKGDNIGTATKSPAKQQPKVYDIKDDSALNNDKLFRWLPVIQKVRKELQSNYGMPELSQNGMDDLTLLSIIDLESNGGDPSIYNGKRHYGLFQQQDSNIFDAYETSPGSEIGDPFPASNFADLRRIHQGSIKSGVWTINGKKQKASHIIFPDEMHKGYRAIMTFFLYMYRYRRRWKPDPIIVAATQVWGPGGGQAVLDYYDQGYSAKEAVDLVKKNKTCCGRKQNAKRSNQIWGYVNNHFLKSYPKVKRRLEELKNKGLLTDSNEFVGPTQTKSISDKGKKAIKATQNALSNEGEINSSNFNRQNPDIPEPRALVDEVPEPVEE